MIRPGRFTPLLVALALAACGDDDADQDAAAQADTDAPAAVRNAPTRPDTGAAVGGPGDEAPVGAADAGTQTGGSPPAGGPSRGTPAGDDATLRADASDAAPNRADAGSAGRLGTPRFTAQVGAFIQPATAQALVERLQAQGVPVWTSQATVEGQEYRRVRVGATSTAAEARRLRAKLKARYGWPVWIAPLGRAERNEVPPEAVGATLQYVES